MIAFAKPPRRKNSLRLKHVRFLEMLPKIREQARLAFRSATPEAQDDLITEVVANAFVAFSRLVEQGRAELAYPTVLANFAIRQVCAGRLVGTTLNVRDVSSRYAQRSKQIRVERLDQFDQEEGEWREALIEDRTAGPAEIAAARIDVSDWLESLESRKYKIARALARGETTTTLARTVGLTAGRISQLRQELQQSWESFQSQAVDC